MGTQTRLKHHGGGEGLFFDPDLENKPLRGWVKRVVVQQAAFAHNAAHCSEGWSKVQKGMFLWIRYRR